MRAYFLRFCILICLGTFSLFADKSPPTPPKEAPPTVVVPANPPPAHPLQNDMNEAMQSLQQVSDKSSSTGFLKIGISFAALILFLFLCVWLLRRVTGSRAGLFSSNKGIKVLERRAISPKSALYLVEVEGKKALISESQLEVKRIIQWDDSTTHLDE